MAKCTAKEILPEPLPLPKEYTLVMNQEEAEWLISVLNNTVGLNTGFDPNAAIYGALRAADVTPTYQIAPTCGFLKLKKKV